MIMYLNFISDILIFIVTFGLQLPSCHMEVFLNFICLNVFMHFFRCLNWLNNVYFGIYLFAETTEGVILFETERKSGHDHCHDA